MALLKKITEKGLKRQPSSPKRMKNNSMKQKIPKLVTLINLYMNM